MSFFVILWSIVRFLFRFMYRVSVIFYGLVGFFSVLLVIFLFWTIFSFISDLDVSESDLDLLSSSGLFDDYVSRFSRGELPEEFILSLSLDEVLVSLEDGIEGVPMRVAIPDYLSRAATDDRVKGLELELGFYSVGLGDVEFLTRSLRSFIEVGKPIYVYGNNLSMSEFPLSQLGDEIWLSRSGLVMVFGYGFESPYLGDFLDSFGFQSFVLRRGKYKTAPDFLARSGASEEEREQVMALLEDWYESSRDLVLSSGRMSRASEFDEMVDGGIYNADLALQKGLVDKLGSYRDFRDRVLSKLLEENGDREEEDSFVGMRRYIYNYEVGGSEVTGGGDGEKTIAYINLSGAIYDAPSDSIFYRNEGINGMVWERRLEELSEDDDIDGVILRVSSGGGEVGASDRLGLALYRLREKKPLFTVIDNIAASGGYYLASSGDKIFIEESAVTGSIGVFLSLLVQDRFNRGFGINWDRFERGRFSNIFSPNRRPNRDEIELGQSYIDWSYDRFISHVSRGRGMEESEVESLAQGRVWSGKAALMNGLADERGGVFEALSMIRKDLGMDDSDRVKFIILPEEQRIESLFEVIMGGYSLFSVIMEEVLFFVQSMGYGVDGTPGLMTRSSLHYGG